MSVKFVLVGDEMGEDELPMFALVLPKPGDLVLLDVRLEDEDVETVKHLPRQLEMERVPCRAT